MISESLKPLIELDKLRKISFDQCDSYVHEDHRWVLPIIFEYQLQGILPKPCKLIMFDAHDDGCEISKKAKEFIIKEYDNLNTSKVIDICKTYLKPQDDDWVKAGMEMGIISDVIAFGVNLNNRWFNKNSINDRNDYKDIRNKSHYMLSLGYPGEEVNGRGYFGDLCKKNESIEQVWNDINWFFINQTGFEFRESNEKILIDFDLDCFAMRWSDYIFPWVQEVYENEFLKVSHYWEKRPWSGKSFLNGLINQAGLLTITREPNFCGGDEKANIILNDVNKYLFDNRLQL